jgi:hypothetical protein
MVSEVDERRRRRSRRSICGMYGESSICVGNRGESEGEAVEMFV